MSKIIIYTNEACPYCKQVKDRLDKEKIKYINKLTKDYKSEWEDISNLTGIPQVPTISYKNNFFVPGRDFGNEDHLVNIINNFNTSSFSTEKISSSNSFPSNLFSAPRKSVASSLAILYFFSNISRSRNLARISFLLVDPSLINCNEPN